MSRRARFEPWFRLSVEEREATAPPSENSLHVCFTQETSGFSERWHWEGDGVFRVEREERSQGSPTRRWMYRVTA